MNETEGYPGPCMGIRRMLLGCPTRALRTLRTRRFALGVFGSETEHELDSQDLGSMMDSLENERNVMKFSEPSFLVSLTYMMNFYPLEQEPPALDLIRTPMLLRYHSLLNVLHARCLTRAIMVRLVMYKRPVSFRLGRCTRAHCELQRPQNAPEIK
jgi:hypothetical protein